MAELALELSESQLLPFDLVNYANFLWRDTTILELKYGDLLESNGAAFGNKTLYRRSHLRYLYYLLRDQF